MNNIVDYQIIQRDNNGFGTATFCGVVPERYIGYKSIYARVVREDDNYAIVDWTECEADGNNWKVTLNIPEGGLYRFEAVAFMPDSMSKDWSKTIYMVHHIGVGDIYVIAGQSNIAGYGRDVAYDPPCMGVHLYANDGNWKLAAHPLNDTFNSIYPENLEDFNCATSPPLSFARSLKNRIGVPIGLVQAAKGGSGLDEWHPKMKANLYKGLQRRIEVVGRFKGVIWYQGCHESGPDLCESYFENFKSMVECWREEFGYIYFLTVQLNRWTDPQHTHDKYWGIVKDAQRRAGFEIDGVSVVPSHDLPAGDGIHNNSLANVTIGERLCNAALRNIYGIPAPIAPNMIKVVAVDDTHFKAFFSGNDVIPMENNAEDVFIEDKDGQIKCTYAVAQGDGSILITTERSFTKPAKFHAYCVCQPPTFIFKERTGLPVLSCYNIDVE